jgi:CRP/FNR family transcriptional regulator, cyclic AMP receptor protein
MATESTLSDEAEGLSRVPLFKRLEPQELEKLAKEVDQVEYKTGETIFNEHDRGDGLYVVDSGSVRIWVLDEDVKDVTLAELKPGDFFGELAVLDRGERSTNATALVDTVLHRLSSDDFHQFLMGHPDIAIDVICEIGSRMRQTNQLVSQRVTRNINLEMEEKLTLGQRIADRVASFGGSWTFILIYCSFLVFWMLVNTFVLIHYGGGENGAQFDPYPYILLNLMLSMTAALQAPIIMMSQNRAAEKDRLAAEQDFKVNLKSELMLEELMRKSRGRDSQIDQLVTHVRSLQENLGAGNEQSTTGIMGKQGEQDKRGTGI